MGRVWPALDIHIPACDPELQELVLVDLDDFHPTALQEAEEASRLRAFFSTHADRDAAAHGLGRIFASGIFVVPVDVEDEDWAARSQAQLHAVTVGRLVIAPPWDTYRSGIGSDDTIVIRPSMGFGTGHHATTRLMLGALQALPLVGRRVLDVGCGSGVLTIAALKLGSASAIGLDIDPDALENARENAALNGAGASVRFVEQDFRRWTAGADVVAANLTGALIAHSAGALTGLVEPGGRLIASGFMEDEAASVLHTLELHGTTQNVTREDGWMCVTLVAPHVSQDG